MRRKTLALAVAVAALALTLLAGGSFAMTNTPSAASGKKATIKVAVVTDIGGLNDRSFNQLANAGRLRAQAKLGVTTRIFVTQSASDRTPNLQAAAQGGYGLVFGTGFFMFEGLNKVAPAFPNTKFAGIDVGVSLLESKPQNVRGLVFKEQEAGYLVGYIAGLVVKQQKGPDVVSAVGANKVPAIVRYIGGYKAGVKKANPKATVIAEYANDPTFSDQAKCKETALNQIARGSQVVFQVAGGCGLGALSAAKEKSVWGIGVDSDQGYLGRHILTSATKKVDVAVFQTVQAYKANPSGFKGGFDKIFNVKSGAIGYGKLAKGLKNRAAIIKKAEKIRKLIASGKIKPPTS